MRDEPWHDKEEIFLGRIERQCNAYHSYYNADYRYYHALSSRFNIPILLISSVNALCAIALNDFLIQRYVSILNAVLSAGTGVLGSIQLYMKINEKMANALRSAMLMKRLALKISKEMSVDREQRTTEGQVFLQECFGELNAALEQGNPIEKRINNFLELGQVPNEMHPTLLDLAAAAVARMSPRKESGEGVFTAGGKMKSPEETRSRMLWGQLDTVRTAESSPPQSDYHPRPSVSTPGGESPAAQDEES